MQGITYSERKNDILKIASSLDILPSMFANVKDKYQNTTAADFGSVPVELVGCFNVISYQTAEYVAFKTLEMENWRHRVWIKHIQFSNRP